MRSRLFVFLLCAVSLTVTACQKGHVQVASLGAVSGFSLQNNTIVLGSRAPTSFTVNGKCSVDTSNIDVSFDSTTWVSAASLATTNSINCSTNGTFSFQFSAVAQPQFAIPNNQPINKIYFRASGNLGMTTVVPLTLALTESNHLITAGSSSTVQGNLTLRSRIVATPKTTSGVYTLGR